MGIFVSPMFGCICVNVYPRALFDQQGPIHHCSKTFIIWLRNWDLISAMLIPNNHALPYLEMAISHAHSSGYNY